MIDSQAEAIKRLISLAKSGAQRSPLVPKVSVDPLDPPPGFLWIREDEGKAYLKVDDATTLLVASATAIPGDGATTIADRSIPYSAMMLNTLTADEIRSGAIGTDELADGAVDGYKWKDVVNAASNLALEPTGTTLPGLRVNVPFDTATDVSRFEFNGVQRFKVGTAHVSVGLDLPNSAMSIQTALSETGLRIRTAGQPFLAEKTNGSVLAQIDASGNLILAGSISSLSGNGSVAGSLAVNGALTVTNQANFLAGAQVAEDTYLLKKLQVGGQSTFNDEIFLTASYSAKFGAAVHARTNASNANRLILEGVSDVNKGELQLGTGGPVLSGSFTAPDRMFIGGQRIVTSAVTGILGNQIAYDTLTGGNGPNVGNIAAQTIQGYNIKDGSITSIHLSPGAVVAAAIANGAVSSVQLGDGSVIDRVVASMGVGKLISGTLNADEIFMGPSGHIYLGINYHSEISNARIQLDASGIRAYNAFNTPLAEFLPGVFNLRTGVDGARVSFGATTGIELYDASGARSIYLAPAGTFTLQSTSDGARTQIDSLDGVTFTAAATRNLAYNPGFINATDKEAAVAGVASDDQVHVYAGDYAVKFQCTNASTSAPSYVDVPFKNTVGTGTSVAPTRVNACPNPGLQVNGTGYLGTGLASVTSPARAAVIGFVNAWALQNTVTGQALSVQQSAPLVTVAATQQWAMSASLRVTSPMVVVCEILWYDASLVLLSTAVSPSITMQANTVRQVGLVGVAPTNAASAMLRVTAPLNAADTMQFTDVMYERASTVGPYSDGNQSGWQWAGTPGLSTSSLTPVAVADSLTNLVSIYIWSDVACYVHIEGRDSTAGVSRGVGVATPVTAGRWNRVKVACSGVMDKVRLHYPSTDPARQTRILTSPVWWSAVQVEANRTNPTPFCAGSEPGCRWLAAPGRSMSVRDVDVIVTQISPNLGVTASGAINGGSLTAASFFAGKIFGTYIQGGTIAGNIITGNLINGDQIVASTIRGTSISARTIDASSIKTATLTATEIAAGTITGDLIAAITIQAGNLSANSVTAEKIAAGQITADKMQANMVLSQRIIVGASATSARVEMTPGMGLQAFTAGGVRTFWVDSSTGNITAIGTWTTGTTGERIQILTDGTMRFYQATGTNYSQIANNGSNLQFRGPLSGSNSGYLTMTATGVAIAYGALGGSVPANFSASSVGIQSWGRLVGIRFQKNFSGDGTKARVFINGTDSDGDDQNNVNIHFEERLGAGNTMDIVWTAHNVAVHGYGGNFEVTQVGNRYAFSGISASNVAAPSSETLKEGIKEITLPNSWTSWDIVEGAPSQEWYYTFEGTPRGDKPRDHEGNPILLRRLRPGYSADSEASDAEKYEYVESEWDASVPLVSQRKKHRFPLAEDLWALDPELVVAGDPRDPASFRTDLRDLLGILWDAVDMLIKRNRVIEAALVRRMPTLVLPGRPQKSDVAAGVGAVIAGRTRRNIDATTGQIRTRILGQLGQL